MSAAGITATIAAMTQLIAAISGLLWMFNLFGRLFAGWRFGASTVELLEVFQVGLSSTEIRQLFHEIPGGDELLHDLKVNENNLKVLAKEIDKSREMKKMLLDMAYMAKIAADEKRRRYIRVRELAEGVKEE